MEILLHSSDASLHIRRDTQNIDNYAESMPRRLLVPCLPATGTPGGRNPENQAIDSSILSWATMLNRSSSAAES